MSDERIAPEVIEAAAKAFDARAAGGADAIRDESWFEPAIEAAICAAARERDVVDAAYVRAALAILVQSEFTGPSYAICRKLEDSLAACEPDWRPVERPS